MKKRRIFSIFCISFLIFASALLSGCTSDKSQIIDNEKIAIQLINSEVVQSEEVSYVEKTIKATVELSDQLDKSEVLVDWYLKSDKYSSSEILNYIQIEPLSDGSTTCYVRCYKPFDDKITLFVKARIGNATASCPIVFEGVPSSLNYNSDSFIQCETLIVDDKTIYLLGERDDVFVYFTYNNIFQNVDKKIFLENCDIKINSYGNLFLKSDNITQSFDLKDFINSTKDGYTSLLNYEFDTLTGCLIIETIDKFPFYPYYFVFLDYCKYDTIVNTSENLPYIEFIITDKTYGFSTNFYIGFNFV